MMIVLFIFLKKVNSLWPSESILGQVMACHPFGTQLLAEPHNNVILSMGTLGTNSSRSWINLYHFSFKKTYMKNHACKLVINVYQSKVCELLSILWWPYWVDVTPILLDLTHHPLDKMAAILQTIYSDAFSWMKIFVFWLKFPKVCSYGSNWQ